MMKLPHVCSIHKLRVKYVYCIYFVTDILQILLVLSMTFQYKSVDVSNISVHVRFNLTSIQMIFKIESTDLNELTFSEDTDKFIIILFGHQEVIFRGNPVEFVVVHEIEMIRDRSGVDLVEALAFWTSFAEEVCKGFEDPL